MSQNAMNATKADELKSKLKLLAEMQGINLGDPENAYTLWSENGPQGYLCWGRSSYPYEVYRLLGHYMFQGAVILDVSANRVTLFTCEIG